MRGTNLLRIASAAWIFLAASCLAQNAPVPVTVLPALTKASPDFVQSRIAQLRNLSGTAIVRLTIASDGLVYEEQLQRSSGQPLLDAAAMVTAIRSQGQSEAHPSGKPQLLDIPVIYPRAKSGARTIAWLAERGLPAGATPPRLLALPTTADTESVMSFVSNGQQVDCEILIGADGIVEDARPVKGRPFDYMTAATLLYIEKQRYAPAVLRGKAVPVRLIERIDWRYDLIGEPRGIGIEGPPWIRMLTRPAPRDNIYADTQRPPVDPAHRSGLLHLQKKEYDAAIDDLSAAFAHQPKNGEILFSRAWVYALRGRPGDVARALADNRRILDLQPDNANAWAARAENYSALKMPVRALPDLTRAIFAAPGDARLYMARGGVRAALGDAAGAAADRKIADTQEPGIALYLQAPKNGEHIWQNEIIMPDGPARLDDNWEKPLVSSALLERLHLSGAVPLMVQVNSRARPDNIKIVTTSGNAVLDKAAILSAAQWAYLPATKGGEAETQEEHWTAVTVEFPKSGEALPMPAWPAGLPPSAVPPQKQAAGDDEILKAMPPTAIVEKQKGTTVLDLLVGADGQVENIAINKSSGHSLLDAAAFQLAGGWRYTPALVNGQPVAARVSETIEWKLPPSFNTE